MNPPHARTSGVPPQDTALVLPEHRPAVDDDLLRRLATATRSWAPAVSPDATRVAYVSDRGGAPEVWVQPLPARAGVEPERVLTTDAGNAMAVSWSPDGAWLGAQVAPGGAPATHVWVLRPDGSDARPVAGLDSSALLGAWALLPGPDGGLRPVVGVGEVASRVDPDGRPGGAWLVDPAAEPGQDRAHVLTDPAPVLLGIDAERRRVLVRRGRRGQREVWLVPLGDPGAARRLSPDGRRACTSGASFRPDGTVHAVSDACTEMTALVALDPDDPAAEPALVAGREGVELADAAVTPAGLALLTWNDAGRSELELVDLPTRRRRPLPALPAQVVHAARLVADGRLLLVDAEGPAQPRGLWIADVGEQTGPTPFTRVTPAPDGFEDVAFVHPVLERLRAADGLELSGWLYRPDRGDRPDEPGPAVIWLHGGPEAQERPEWGPLYQLLLRAGVSVFGANVRGSSGFGRSFVNADNLDRRWSAIDDVRACAQHLVTTGVAAPGRIAVMGRSYGGYLTLAALTAFPDVWAAGIDICGMADLLTFYRDTEPWIGDAAVSKYGDPVRDAELLRELSPIHRIDRLAAPLLVVHGAADTNVPFGEAEQVVAALRDRGHPHRYLVFPNEGHDVEEVANKVPFVDTCLDWLLRWL